MQKAKKTYQLTFQSHVNVINDIFGVKSHHVLT
jgi:hypothetical protein